MNIEDKLAAYIYHSLLVDEVIEIKKLNKIGIRDHGLVANIIRNLC